MPRIDPLQLLRCLSVLLTSEGGILSRDEVPRLVNLMTKFSKKLVSKCTYILILKSTETSLVDMFMAEGGWNLINAWLQDATKTGNWVLVREILDLLLVTPVDVERLKSNGLPKLIKNLSRREDLPDVAEVSHEIVMKWLTIVKGSTAASTPAELGESDSNVDPAPDSTKEESMVLEEQNSEEPAAGDEVDNKTSENGHTLVYKVSIKDGKQVIKKLSVDNTGGDEEAAVKNFLEKSKEVKSKSSSREKDKRRSSSSSRSKSSSSSKDKDRKDRRRDRDKSKSSSSSPSNSSKHISSSSKSSSSKSSRDNKSKQAEKDKDTLEKIKPQTIDKLGKIPKKSSDDKKENKTDNVEKKKPTFSILNKKASGEERTKTVKIFNSKMRSTGLEEEVKPPPPRTGKKPATPSVQLPTIPPKRPSPPREFSSSGIPPEKKLKLDKVDLPERPGAIKLIPPKPKPAVLQESDMFMDALTASAPKKEAKKRKRRPSVTKDTSTPTSPTSSPSTSTEQAVPTSPTTAAFPLKNIAPINFYQDTLTEDGGENGDDEECPASPTTPTDAQDEDEPVKSVESPEPIRIGEGGLRGVLLHCKKKGPKRSIKWKADDDLEEIRYFELDETERVNVTKTFMDMAKMEMNSEREALIMSRKLPNEDVMEPQTVWHMLYLCDQPPLLAPPGCKSLEKDIQFAREKTVPQAIYFDKRRIPDSPEEPIPETHHISDPRTIPLEDPECNEIDLRNTPWPEPKNFAPQQDPQPQPQLQPQPQMFNPAMAPQFNPNFNGIPPGGPPFMGMPPRFPMNPINMMGGPPPPDMMPNQRPMFPPGGGNDPNFNPMPQFNGGPMFPNNFRGRGGGGGGFRRNGGWVQMNGPPRNSWKGRGGGRGGKMCKNIQNHGYCRNGDNCPFIH